MSYKKLLPLNYSKQNGCWQNFHSKGLTPILPITPILKRSRRRKPAG
jgi:hypothetical protein